MERDPIVTETRQLREEYAAGFGHNRDAICDDIMKRQKNCGRKLVHFAPRAPKHKPEAA